MDQQQFVVMEPIVTVLITEELALIIKEYVFGINNFCEKTISYSNFYPVQFNTTSF